MQIIRVVGREVDAAPQMTRFARAQSLDKKPEFQTNSLHGRMTPLNLCKRTLKYGRFMDLFRVYWSKNCSQDNVVQRIQVF